MKKIFAIVLMAVATLSFTSCISGTGDSDTTQKFNATMYNRVPMEDKDSAQLSVGNFVVEVNYTQSTVSLMIDAYVNNTAVAATISNMTLTYSKDINAYYFSGSNTAAGITYLSGYWDMEVGAMYLEYTVNGTMVYATSILPYYYANTCVTDADGKSFNSEEMQYEFRLDTKNKTASLNITQFHLIESEAATSTVPIDGFQYKVTAAGYEITADRVITSLYSEGSSAGMIITNFKAEITKQGTVVAGEYEALGKKITFNGTIFKNLP